MNTYYVVARTSCHWGALYVKANSPQGACNVARRKDPGDIAYQPYQDVGDIEEIEIYQDDSEAELLFEWKDKFHAMREDAWLMYSHACEAFTLVKRGDVAQAMRFLATAVAIAIKGAR